MRYYCLCHYWLGVAAGAPKRMVSGGDGWGTYGAVTRHDNICRHCHWHGWWPSFSSLSRRSSWPCHHHCHCHCHAMGVTLSSSSVATLSSPTFIMATLLLLLSHRGICHGRRVIVIFSGHIVITVVHHLSWPHCCCHHAVVIMCAWFIAIISLIVPLIPIPVPLVIVDIALIALIIINGHVTVAFAMGITSLSLSCWCWCWCCHCHHPSTQRKGGGCVIDASGRVVVIVHRCRGRVVAVLSMQVAGSSSLSSSIDTEGRWWLCYRHKWQGGGCCLSMQREGWWWPYFQCRWQGGGGCHRWRVVAVLLTWQGGRHCCPTSGKTNNAIDHYLSLYIAIGHYLCNKCNNCIMASIPYPPYL